MFFTEFIVRKGRWIVKAFQEGGFSMVKKINDFLAGLPMTIVAGVFAFSSFWGILEVFDQRKRVLKGWFPKNPKRLKDYAGKSDK